MTELEKLIMRKEKAEKLSLDQLEKYLIGYINLLADICKAEAAEDNKDAKEYAACVTCSFIEHGINDFYGEMLSQMLSQELYIKVSSYMLSAVKDGDLCKLQAILDAVDDLHLRRKRAGMIIGGDCK